MENMRLLTELRHLSHSNWAWIVDISTLPSINEGLSGKWLETSGNRLWRFPARFRQIFRFSYQQNFFFQNVIRKCTDTPSKLFSTHFVTVEVSVAFLGKPSIKNAIVVCHSQWVQIISEEDFEFLFNFVFPKLLLNSMI